MKLTKKKNIVIINIRSIGISDANSSERRFATWTLNTEHTQILIDSLFWSVDWISPQAILAIKKLFRHFGVFNCVSVYAWVSLESLQETCLVGARETYFIKIDGKFMICECVQRSALIIIRFMCSCFMPLCVQFNIWIWSHIQYFVRHLFRFYFWMHDF